MKKLPKITALILALSLACGCSEVFPDSNASGKDTSASVSYTHLDVYKRQTQMKFP